MFDPKRKEQVRALERQAFHESKEDPYRLKFHLMPMVGWMNDPNGLCQFKGMYHVFFQYSPLHVEGGMKSWGHYISEDLVNWKYAGVPFYPDKEFDQNGVYSGSALISDKRLYLYYTGNVKKEGDYDYITEGRESNTVCVVSKDGIQFSEKKLVLTQQDYPKNCTCHIRDPKVWEEGGDYFMLLGARLTGDQGAALLYKSKDKRTWAFENEITISPSFGYMWECPDYIRLRGEQFFSCCPQGVEHEEYKNQNIYSAGYFKVEGDLTEEYGLLEFVEWDLGFDFYAPQTFVNEHGRVILIGWAGLPDAPYANATVKRGWQHTLTVPRDLRLENDHIYQYPVNELLELREECLMVSSRKKMTFENGIFDLEVSGIYSAPCHVTIADCVHIHYKEGEITLSFTEDAGCGRDVRKGRIRELDSMRILADTSLLEIYLNDGECVFTTRYYKKGEGNSFVVECDHSIIHAWRLRAMEVGFNE